MASVNPLALFLIDNAFGHMFNALYLNPECDDPSILDTSSVSPSDLVMFKKMLEDTQKAMLRGRDRITGNSSEKYERMRNQGIDLFNQLFPASKRSETTQSVVYVISDVVFGMVKGGGPDADLCAKLPPLAISIINKLTALFQESGLSDEEKDDLIDDITHEVAKTYPE